MQNTNFAELPDSIRTIMKSSIEHARKAFDTFVASSEKMLQGLDTSSTPAAENLKQLHEKIAAFTRHNVEANFNLALRLTDARQLSEIIELQNAHVREQRETFSRQLEELRELTMKAVKDGSRAEGGVLEVGGVVEGSVAEGSVSESEVGAHEIGSPEVGAPEVGVAVQRGALEVGGAAEVGLPEVGVAAEGP
jgi:hypothetical protein